MTLVEFRKRLNSEYAVWIACDVPGCIDGNQGRRAAAFEVLVLGTSAGWCCTRHADEARKVLVDVGATVSLTKRRVSSSINPARCRDDIDDQQVYELEAVAA